MSGGARARRVADEIRRVLAVVIQRELRDPRLGLVTVTSVDLSPDLRNAKVWVSSLGGDDSSHGVRTLEHAAPFLRRELARAAELRFTPRLTFAWDDSVERGMRVDRLIEEVRPAGDDAPAADEGDAGEGGGGRGGAPG